MVWFQKELNPELLPMALPSMCESECVHVCFPDKQVGTFFFIELPCYYSVWMCLCLYIYNQTLKFNTWYRADWWDEGRCALCLPHLSTPVIQPSDGRQREPLPLPAVPDEIKGLNRQRNWESCSTNPPTQSAETTKSPLREAGSCTVQPQSDLSKPHWSTSEVSALLKGISVVVER